MQKALNRQLAVLFFWKSARRCQLGINSPPCFIQNKQNNTVLLKALLYSLSLYSFRYLFDRLFLKHRQPRKLYTRVEIPFGAWKWKNITAYKNARGKGE